MSAISIEDVSFAYDDSLERRKPGEEQVLALKGIDLQIPDGQFVCLIGHSGSGKSTLLRLLLGLDAPTGGRICIDGVPVDGPGLDRSFVFQDYSLFPWMKAKENVEFGVEQANKELGRGLTRAEISEIAALNLQRVEMADAADKYPYQLSGGMQQRVAIARALAMDADILVFDEPFGALDVKTRRALQELVDELWRSGARRKTVVFVTPDIPESILLADRVVFMRDGRIVADNLVELPRPRTPEGIARDSAARELADELTELFYESERGAAGASGASGRASGGTAESAFVTGFGLDPASASGRTGDLPAVDAFGGSSGLEAASAPGAGEAR